MGGLWLWTLIKYNIFQTEQSKICTILKLFRQNFSNLCSLGQSRKQNTAKVGSKIAPKSEVTLDFLLKL
jgi:hypothetical protein